jgi:adenylate kinase family enzyme
VRRILVYGVTGSGKSTLARQIGERRNLPYHAVDDLTWEANWVPVPVDVQRQRITEICAGDDWVIDSAYGAWVDVPLARADLIVGLDLPRWRSFGRLLRRTIGNVVLRRPTCNGNHETFRLSFLSRDSILVWHFQSFARKRRRMRAWQDDPEMPRVVLLRTPRQVREWLTSMS